MLTLGEDILTEEEREGEGGFYPYHAQKVLPAP